MKFLYIFVVIVSIIVLFLGISIFSSASAVTSSVTSAASGFQKGGRKSNILFSMFNGFLAYKNHEIPAAIARHNGMNQSEYSVLKLNNVY
jgi:hypothetical protein